ncbi:MAG: monovalent cation/H+ antiporter subunit D family protein [Desulfurivibrio sp.]
METVISIQPILTIVVSLAATALIICFGEKRRNYREISSLAAGLVKFLLVASMIPAIMDGKVIEFTLVEILPGIELKFKADALALVFALGASFLWIITTVYGVGYMRSGNEKSQTRFFACFAVALSATMGVAFSANLFTLFLFYEALTIVTYPLVNHKELPESKAGARKYAIYLLGAAKTFLLIAIIITYNLTGTLEFNSGGIFPPAVQAAYPGVLTVLFCLYLFGFAKSAIMPLHGWLPAAMVAPTPVSALLHAVAVVKTGVYSVLKVILFVFGIDLMSALSLDVLAIVLSSFTIVVASVLALSQDNLKARLAYSTISQLSYIILGGALLTASGITGGILHITNHAFAKITLFFCAGSIYIAAHKTEISQLSGIARRMPWTMAAFTIGALGMIGVPMVGGFVTKWYLLLGALERDSLLVLLVLLSSTVLNAAYFLPIIYKAYFEPEPVAAQAHDHHQQEIRERPMMVVPLVITAAITIVVGCYPDLLLALVNQVFK